MSSTEDSTGVEQTSQGAGRRPSLGSLEALSLGRYAGVIVALIVVAAVLTVTQSTFLTWDNMKNIIAANSVILILGLGATFVVITAGIDLSTASLMTACSMMLAIAFKYGWALDPAVVLALAFGAAAGWGNGFLIAKGRISFLAVTLGALSIWQSFSLVVQEGQTVSVFSSSAFKPIHELVTNDIGPIPLLLIFDVALILIFGGVLRYTTFGRSLFAIGSNEEAARLSGINVSRVLILVYTLAGLAAGLACLVSVGRLTAGSPTPDPNLLLTVLAAVLIGGTSFTGGLGGVAGTAIGVIFLGVVENGLTLSNVSSFWQGIVSGSILIIAVGFGVLRERGWSIRRARGANAAVTEGPVRCAGSIATWSRPSATPCCRLAGATAPPRRPTATAPGPRARPSSGSPGGSPTVSRRACRRTSPPRSTPCSAIWPRPISSPPPRSAGSSCCTTRRPTRPPASP
jgi:ribose/xylose/arabinose/galactoside ABC-type transport system permease subunit